MAGELGFDDEEIEIVQNNEYVNKSPTEILDDQTSDQREQDVDEEYERQVEINYCTSLRDQLIFCTRRISAPYVTLVAIKACDEIADRFGACRRQISDKYGITLTIDPEHAAELLEKQ